MASVFPHSGNKVLDRIVPVSTAHSVWNLALFDEKEDLSHVLLNDNDNDNGARTLYAQGSLAKMNLRENVVELLDMADSEFGCDQVVVVLDKADKHFAEVLHALMYVGGIVVSPDSSSPLKAHSNSYILVGIDV